MDIDGVDLKAHSFEFPSHVPVCGVYDGIAHCGNPGSLPPPQAVRFVQQQQTGPVFWEWFPHCPTIHSVWVQMFDLQQVGCFTPTMGCVQLQGHARSQIHGLRQQIGGNSGLCPLFSGEFSKWIP